MNYNELIGNEYSELLTELKKLIKDEIVQSKPITITSTFCLIVTIIKRKQFYAMKLYKFYRKDEAEEWKVIGLSLDNIEEIYKTIEALREGIELIRKYIDKRKNRNRDYIQITRYIKEDME